MARKKNKTGKKQTKPAITDWEFSSESLLDGKEQDDQEILHVMPRKLP